MAEPEWSDYRALATADRQRARWALRNSRLLETDGLNSAALAWGRRQVVLAVVIGAVFFIVGIIAIGITSTAGFAFFIPTFGMTVSAITSRRQVRRFLILTRDSEGEPVG